MRYPGFLPKNGCVGVIAPSFGCTTEPYASQFKSAVSFLEGEGYRVLPGENCFLDEGTGKSSTPEKCGAEINRFFLGGEADVLISAGGGETMCEDLGYVDFEALGKAEPKWFMGYSDNTNLTFLLPTLCDTVAVYGTNFPAFGIRPLPECVTDSLRLLKGEAFTFKNYSFWEKESLRTPETPLIPYNTAEPFRMTRYPAIEGPVRFSGRLLGGCLDCLITLCGTKFDRVKAFTEKYREDGIVWFLEACDLDPVGIRRALWQLKNAGWFDTAKGFLIGRPLRFDEEAFGLDRCSAVTGILGDTGLPILMDLDIGHLPPRMPLIEGALAEVSAGENSVSVAMRLR